MTQIFKESKSGKQREVQPCTGNCEITTSQLRAASLQSQENWCCWVTAGSGCFLVPAESRGELAPQQALWNKTEQ